MAGWTKLFSSIVTSSVWCEPHATVRVWIAMLASADAEGVVEGSLPGFANLARVSLDEMREAVATLSSPDPDSRTADHEGRRIEPFPGGWLILNYGLYRQRAQDKEGSRAPAMRALRARRKAEREQPPESNALPPRVTGDPEERGERRESPPFNRSAGRPNPLLANGDRKKLEEEWLQLVHRLADLTSEDRLDVAARASDYEGAKRTKVNPASMTDDRLINTVRDLRRDVATEERKRAAQR